MRQCQPGRDESQSAMNQSKSRNCSVLILIHCCAVPRSVENHTPGADVALLNFRRRDRFRPPQRSSTVREWSLRIVPCGKRRGDESGSAAQRPGETQEPQLGGGALCGSSEAFAWFHHAAGEAFVERHGESDDVLMGAAGVRARSLPAFQNASAEWIPSDSRATAIFLRAVL